MIRRGVSIVACICALASGGDSRAAELPPDQNPVDCGAYALYHLLRLEGVDVSPDRIWSSLPRSHPDGCSMKELKDVAAHLGLGLRGMNLPREPGAIDRPALAFLQLEGHGHYVVVRPVGHTGQLIQVIDEVGEPQVIDALRLFASPRWTGTALIPSRTNWPLVVAGSSLAALVGLGMIRHLKVRSVVTISRSNGTKLDQDRAENGPLAGHVSASDPASTRIEPREIVPFKTSGPP